MKKKSLNTLFVLLGALSFIIGILFLFLPILPTVPFFVFAAYCFSKVSAKFHGWLVDSKLFRIVNDHKPVHFQKLTLLVLIPAVVTLLMLLVLRKHF